jgi:hypothetical protein
MPAIVIWLVPFALTVPIYTKERRYDGRAGEQPENHGSYQGVGDLGSGVSHHSVVRPDYRKRLQLPGSGSAMGAMVSQENIAFYVRNKVEIDRIVKNWRMGPGGKRAGAGGAPALPRFGEGVGAGPPMDRATSQLALCRSRLQNAR